MNQNILLFFVLLIVLLMVGIGENNKYQIDKKDINVKKHLKEDPCFLYENTNRSQVIYLKLVDVLKKLSSNPMKTLGKNCKQSVFIQGTTDNRLRSEVGEITAIILGKINSMTGFYFRKVYYDTITIFEDQCGNKNFIYNVFINDPHEELDIRLYINVIKYIKHCKRDEKEITCTSVTTPGMNTFEIGYPKPEQLIPLPTEVITTGGAPDLLSVKGINIKKIPPIKSLYLNEVKIYNTNAVIDANGKCLMDPVCGNIKETTLSSSAYNGLNTPFFPSACLYNKWPDIIPEGMKGMKSWPCASPSLYWNRDGIPTPPTCNTQVTGTRSSTTQIPLAPTFNPTIPTIPRNSGPYYSWLFSLTRGDVATDGADFTD